MRLLTIITVNKNNANGLAKTAKSITGVKSTYKELVEWIVIDGNSSDNSLQVIDYYNSELSKWVSESDQGIYDAMNKGLLLATSKYVVFMNSGDAFYRIDDVLNQLRKSSAGIVYGDFYIQGIEKKELLVKQTPQLDFAFLLAKTINHQSYFLQREIAINYLFSLKYRIISDWIQLFEILKTEKEISVHYLGIPISIYDGTGVSSTNDTLRIQEKQEYLEQNYSNWELNSLLPMSRLRQRNWYSLILKSLDSPRRSSILSFLARIL